MFGFPCGVDQYIGPDRGNQPAAGQRIAQIGGVPDSAIPAGLPRDGVHLVTCQMRQDLAADETRRTGDQNAAGHGANSESASAGRFLSRSDSTVGAKGQAIATSGSSHRIPFSMPGR